MPPLLLFTPGFMMAFRDSVAQFQFLDVSLLDPDPDHARQSVAEDALKGLVNSIQKVGVIHPLIVRPGSSEGRYTVVVGERRRQAALRAGEKTVPVIVRACAAGDALVVLEQQSRLFEDALLAARVEVDHHVGQWQELGYQAHSLVGSRNAPCADATQGGQSLRGEWRSRRENARIITTPRTRGCNEGVRLPEPGA